MNLPSASYAQVNHIFGGPGYPRGAQVTYGIKAVGTFSDVAALALRLHGYWATNVMSQLSMSLTLLSTRVKAGPDETGPFAFAGGPLTGGISGDADSPNVAVLVKKNTASGGKANSGRWFLPGLSETFTSTGGTIDSAYLANLQGGINAFLQSVIDDVAVETMVLLHSNAITLPTLITSLSVQNKVATQRRRLRKVGGRRRIVV